MIEPFTFRAYLDIKIQYCQMVPIIKPTNKLQTRTPINTRSGYRCPIETTAVNPGGQGITDL